MTSTILLIFLVGSISFYRAYFNKKEASLKKRLIIGASIGLIFGVLSIINGIEMREIKGRVELEPLKALGILILLSIGGALCLTWIGGDVHEEIDTQDPDNISLKERVRVAREREKTRNKSNQQGPSAGTR